MINKRILVSGATGLLGTDVVRDLASEGYEVVACDRSVLDITVSDQVQSALVEGQFAHVVNCAAYTAVDEAERDVPGAVAGNVTGPENLARACARTGTRLIHISTDYVFDGQKPGPYEVDDVRNPVNVYGQTKSDGEDAVFAQTDNAVVIRTSWLYGKNGRSFPQTILGLLKDQATVSVVDDQRGQPTYSLSLARAITSLVGREDVSGTLHFSGSGTASWFDFARAVARVHGLGEQRIAGVPTAEFLRPARRPWDTTLSHKRWLDAGLPQPAHWSDMLDEAEIQRWH